MARYVTTGGWLFILTACLLPLLGCTTAIDAVNPSKAAVPLNPALNLRLPTPTDTAHQTYLGIKPNEDFALTDIRARVILIEVFDMYCPHCRREAPYVNQLYQRISNDPSLSNQIKVIGIGAGNTKFEVNVFRKTFQVEFPLFTDRSRQFAQRLEVRQTPTFIGFANRDDGRLQRILFNPGPIGEVEGFLNRLVQGADLAANPDT